MMILYTVVPLEQIFAESSSPSAPLMHMDLGRACLLLERIGDGRARVVRIISPNPNDYLRPQFQPGRIIEFLPVTHAGR